MCSLNFHIIPQFNPYDGALELLEGPGVECSVQQIWV